MTGSQMSVCLTVEQKVLNVVFFLTLYLCRWHMFSVNNDQKSSETLHHLIRSGLRTDLRLDAGSRLGLAAMLSYHSLCQRFRFCSEHAIRSVDSKNKLTMFVKTMGRWFTVQSSSFTGTISGSVCCQKGILTKVSAPSVSQSDAFQPHAVHSSLMNQTFIVKQQQELQSVCCEWFQSNSRYRLMWLAYWSRNWYIFSLKMCQNLK